MEDAFDPRTVPLSGINLVEASAGTGKTHAITDLYERLIVERGCAVDEILVVTYTKAATAELRERIRGRLVARLVQLRKGGREPLLASPPRLGSGLADETVPDVSEVPVAVAERRLQVASQRFDQAAVFTIHGFCQRALDESAFESGQPFGCELAVDGDALVAEITRDFWRQETARVSRRWADYLLSEGGGPDALLRWVRPLVARSHLRIVVPSRPESVDTLAVQYRARFSEASAQWKHGRDALQRLLLDSPALHRSRYPPAQVPKWLLHLDEFFDSEHEACRALPKAIAEHLRRLSPEALGTGTKKGHTAPSHPFFQCADSLHRTALGLADAYAANLADMRHRLLVFVRTELARRNRENRTRTFDDLLLGLDDALHSTPGECSSDTVASVTSGERERTPQAELASTLRRRFPYALIDEFQDTDPVQLSIFRAIYGQFEGAAAAARPASGVFLVGDPKQAIYGFRGADVFAYLHGRAEAARVYTLNTNWRSVGGLVQGVNRLFGRVVDPFVVPAINYQTVTAGRARSLLSLDEEPDQPFRVWQLPEREDGGAWLKNEARTLATQATAGAIRALVLSGGRGSARIDGRALSGGDIAVLVRTNREGELVQEALSEAGIRSVCTGSTNVFFSDEAIYVEWLLAAVCTPRREAAVRAVLASPMFERSGNELDRLAQDELGWDAELAEFYRWRDLWRARGFGTMYRDVLESAAVAVRILGRPFGERRMTNLLHLGELLQSAEVSLHASPEELLTWFSRKRGGRMHGGEEAELRLESDAALVRVVTVHRAKGLQYPIVFCPFMWDAGPRRNTPNGGVIFHDDEAGEEAVLDLSVPPSERARRAADRESLSESVRLLYVALTRAQERLYLVWASARGAENSALAWLLRAGPVGPAACSEVPATARRNSASGPRQPSKPTKQMAKPAAQTWLEYGAAWESMRLENPNVLAIEPLPSTDLSASVAVAEPAGADHQTARRFRGNTEQRWRVASFTSLTSQLSAEVPDHDAEVRVRDDPNGSEALDQIPRGARAGTCIHTMLERLEVTRPVSEQRELVSHALEEHGFDRGLTSNHVALLTRVLAVDLRPPTELRLNGIGAGKRVCELEFYFPVRSVALRGITELARAHGYLSGASIIAPEARLAGFLKGYVDLIFEQQGRYYIVDYKTHWLGPSETDYSPDRLRGVMRADGYELQYLIYSVALHRYLGARLRNYDYERNFGGAYYLFLRGMGLGPTENGIYFERPPAQLIHAINNGLGG